MNDEGCDDDDDDDLINLRTPSKDLHEKGKKRNQIKFGKT
jgi:hypothetical protein